MSSRATLVKPRPRPMPKVVRLPARPVQPEPTLTALVRWIHGCVRRGYGWLQQKRVQQMSARRLRVAETLSLGEKRFVSIVRVDGIEMLVGSSSGNITLLKILDKKKVPSRRVPKKVKTS